MIRGQNPFLSRIFEKVWDFYFTTARNLKNCEPIDSFGERFTRILP